MNKELSTIASLLAKAFNRMTGTSLNGRDLDLSVHSAGDPYLAAIKAVSNDFGPPVHFQANLKAFSDHNEVSPLVGYDSLEEPCRTKPRKIWRLELVLDRTQYPILAHSLGEME